MLLHGSCYTLALALLRYFHASIWYVMITSAEGLTMKHAGFTSQTA
jgi:hypothetical protein